MERVIISKQACDMGDGYGEWVFNKAVTLGEFLTHLKEHSNEWGIITIKRRNGDILRKFDYNTYSDTILYTHLNGWEEKFEIDKVEFRYCFMNEDIEITLNK